MKITWWGLAWLCLSTSVAAVEVPDKVPDVAPVLADPTHFNSTAWGLFAVDAEACAHGVLVEFEGSGVLAAAVGKRFTAAGCVLAESRESAAIALALTGTYTDLNRGKTLTYDLKDLVHEPPIASADTGDAPSTASVNTPVAVPLLASAGMAHGVATSTLSTPVGISQIAGNLAQASGLSGWVNRKLTGDERGFVFCLSNCTRHQQAVQVIAKNPMGRTFNAQVSYVTEVLTTPEQLFDTTADLLVERLLEHKKLNTKEQ